MPTSIRQSGIHTVRTYSPEQFPALCDVFDAVALHSQQVDAGLRPVSVKALEASRAVVLGRTAFGDFAGIARLISHSDDNEAVAAVAEIGTLWVPDSGRGGAKDLIRAATEYALDIDRQPVAVANSRAIGVFEKCDFEAIAVAANGKTLMAYCSGEALSAASVRTITDLPRFSGSTALQLAA